MPRAAAAEPLLQHDSPLPARKDGAFDSNRLRQPLPIGASLCDRLLFAGRQRSSIRKNEGSHHHPPPIGAVLCDQLLFAGSQTPPAATSTGSAGTFDSYRQFLLEQRELYGARLLLFLTIVNLLYGTTTSWFIYINNYYLGVDCGLSPARTQSAVATMGLCIIVRPILGTVSDAVPIRGSRRKAYFFIAGIGSACCYLALAVLTPGTQLSPWASIALLCVANVLGYAWCGVILYAIVAEEQRRDPVHGAANLNALQWGCYSTGALVGDLSEGFLLKMAGRPHHCYWMMFLLWSLMAVCGLLYERQERRVKRKTRKASVATPQDSAVTSPYNAAQSAACPTSRTADNLQPDIEATELKKEPNLGRDHTTSVEEHGFAVQLNKLWIALDPKGPTEGVILRAVLYIFLTWVLVPDVSTAVTYFFYTSSMSIGGLGFGDVTYSMLSVVADVAMLAACYIYGAFLGSTPLRKLFIALQLLNVAASALDLALALRWNEAIGVLTQLNVSLLVSHLPAVGCRYFSSAQVDATVFAGVDQAIFYCAWQLKNLPVYTLAAKLCPPGVEATLTAIIAGLNDLSGALAQFSGAWVTKVCGVTGESPQLHVQQVIWEYKIYERQMHCATYTHVHCAEQVRGWITSGLCT